MLIGAYMPFSAAPLGPTEAQNFQQALRLPHGPAPSGRQLDHQFAVGTDVATLPNGELVLFSGHIENRQNLRQSLRISGPTDGELYAAAYAAWGDAADLRVIGTYATIILTRDAPLARLAASPNSCLPLHYYHDDKQFIVASRAQAIFDTGRVARIISEHKIADSLFLNYHDSEQGWFEGVKRLAGGTRAFISPKGVRIDRYYDLANVPDIRLKSDRDYVEAADALFLEGTRLMLDGLNTPAVSLSGGYDSQAVAAYTLRARPDQPLHGYTSIPEQGWDGINSENRFGDERPYVQALADMYPHLQPHFIDSAGRSFDHFQREMFAFSLQAQRNAMNLHWIHDIRQMAKSDGCDVMLTGAFGNATFSYVGDQALSGWLAKGKIGPLLRELATGGSLTSLPRRLVGRTIMPLMPRGLWEWVQKLRHGSTNDPFSSWCPMNRDYAQEMRVKDRATAANFDPQFRPHVHSRDMRAKMLTMAGGEGADTMLAISALHGLPNRDPTSYRPLAEFCLGIPDDQYLRAGIKRWLAKRMLRAKVPDMVLRETRRGRQAADWHLRLSRQRTALIEEIDWLKEDAAINRRLNLDGLRQALIDFPDKTPNDQATSARLQLALTRGLTTARFIRYLEGRNF
jgi:asparagine synthase (glutamine-hydrolysing)